MNNEKRAEAYRRDLNMITFAAFFLVLFSFSGIFLALVTRNVLFVFISSLSLLFSLIFTARLQFRLDKKYKGITATWKEYSIMIFFNYIVLILLPFGFCLGLISVPLHFSTNTLGPMIFVYLNVFVLSLFAFLAVAPWNQLMRSLHKAKKLTKKEILQEVYTLARRLEVEISEIYVLQRKKIKVANAFQVGIRPKYFSVFVSDYLLENFTKEEVNAVIAHELAHARERHLLKILVLLVPYILFLVNLYAYSIVIRDWTPGHFWMEVATLMIIVLIIIAFPSYLISAIHRRFELKADSLAVYALGDSKPVVSALGKLAELNLFPKKLSRIAESLAYHPSIETRIRKINQDRKIEDFD